jgi:MarR family transcriptional regulator for hemolysin
MSTDRNNISSLIKRMEVMGLIERKTLCEDQRRKIINLTPKGKIMFKKGKAIAHQLESEVLSSLDATEKRMLFEALKKLTSNLGEKIKQI